MITELNITEYIKVTAIIITVTLTAYKIFSSTRTERIKTSKEQYIEIIDTMKDNKSQNIDAHSKAKIKTILQIKNGKNICHEATDYIIKKEVFPEYFQIYVHCQNHIEFNKETGFYPKKTPGIEFYYSPTKPRKYAIWIASITFLILCVLCLLSGLAIFGTTIIEDQSEKSQVGTAFMALFLSFFYFSYDLSKVSAKLAGIEKLMKLHTSEVTTPQAPQNSGIPHIE